MADTTTEPSAASATSEKLTSLTTAANLQYSLKNYTGAADIFSEATELQAEVNGEMAPENADLLFSYGRCLYKVAIAKSDVLGGKVAAEEKKPEKKKKKEKAADAGEGSSTAAGASANETVKTEEVKQEDGASKPYFQLTGMENWSDTDSDSDEDSEGEAEEAEDDDLANAFEVLDVARVLLSRQLESLQSQSSDSADKGKTKVSEDTPGIKQVKERLADTHDLLGEISLENERFTDAIADFRASLELRKQLVALGNSLLTEAHYKVSLALEFASMSKVREAQIRQEAGQTGEGAKVEDAKVDMEMREEAAGEMEKAIESLEARLKKETKNLEALDGEKKREQEKEVKDVGEMLEEMRQRLIDLRADPTKQPENPLEGMDPEIFSGLLGSMLGADPATQKAKIEEATKNANDLTGMVKKKAKAPEPSANGSANGTASGSGKRKLEVEDDGREGKRGKTEELA